MVLLCIFCLSVCRAQEDPYAFLGEVIGAPGYSDTTVYLWPEGAPGALGSGSEDKPFVQILLPPPEKATGAGIILCPGGGYEGLQWDGQGYIPGRWFNYKGIAAFVLKYRVRPYGYPEIFLDGVRAMRLVRSLAPQIGVDPDRIGMMGGSAGGHLASSVGTHFDDGSPDSSDPVERMSSRPDFLILKSAVITLRDPYAYTPCRSIFLGDNPTQAMIDSFSNELQVTSRTGPSYLIHGQDDGAVLLPNAQMFYDALVDSGVEAHLQIVPGGGHDFSDVIWRDSVYLWLDRQGFLATGGVAIREIFDVRRYAPGLSRGTSMGAPLRPTMFLANGRLVGDGLLSRNHPRGPDPTGVRYSTASFP